MLGTTSFHQCQLSEHTGSAEVLLPGPFSVFIPESVFMPGHCQYLLITSHINGKVSYSAPVSITENWICKFMSAQNCAVLSPHFPLRNRTGFFLREVLFKVGPGAASLSCYPAASRNRDFFASALFYTYWSLFIVSRKMF